MSCLSQSLIRSIRYTASSIAAYLVVLVLVTGLSFNAHSSTEDLEKSAVIREIITFGYLNNHFQQQIIQAAIECLDQDLGEPKVLTGQWSLELGKLRDITRSCERIIDYFFHTPIAASFEQMQLLSLLRDPFKRRIDQDKVLYQKIFDGNIAIEDRGFRNKGTRNQEWRFGLVTISPKTVEFNQNTQRMALMSIRNKMLEACIMYSTEPGLDRPSSDYLRFEIENSIDIKYYLDHFVKERNPEILYKCDTTGIYFPKASLAEQHVFLVDEITSLIQARMHEKFKTLMSQSNSQYLELVNTSPLLLLIDDGVVADIIDYLNGGMGSEELHQLRKLLEELLRISEKNQEAILSNLEKSLESNEVDELLPLLAAVPHARAYFTSKKLFQDEAQSAQLNEMYEEFLATANEKQKREFYIGITVSLGSCFMPAAKALKVMKLFKYKKPLDTIRCTVPMVAIGSFYNYDDYSSAVLLSAFSDLISDSSSLIKTKDLYGMLDRISLLRLL